MFKNKLKKIINKNNAFYLIAILIVAIFFVVNLFDLKYKIGSQSIYPKIIAYSIVCFIISIITILFLRIKNTSNIPKLFLVFGFIIGSVFLFASPLFTGSDEHNHYFRIYEISQGVIKTPINKYVGSKLPESLSETFKVNEKYNTKIKYNDVYKMNKIKLNKKNTSAYGDKYENKYNNTALYSPVSYAPHAIGFFIGRILNLKPLYIGMLGRIFNFISYIGLGFIAIKKIPKFKWFYFAILLSPNMIQCATTLSADAFINVLTLLYIAYIYSICSKNKIVNFKDKFILFILSLAIGLCKVVYFPIILLIFLISKDKYKKGAKEKYITSTIIMLISIAFSLLWLKSTGDILEIAYPKADLQKHFILTNPIEYIIIIIRTYIVYIIDYIECLFVGFTMYHSQLKIHSIISFLYVALVIYLLIGDNLHNELTNKNRIIVILVSIAVTVLITTAIYVQCTAGRYSLANPVVEGIQGRYFIPVIFLLPFILNFKTKKININEKIALTSILSINLITIFYIINNFLI